MGNHASTCSLLPRLRQCHHQLKGPSGIIPLISFFQHQHLPLGLAGIQRKPLLVSQLQPRQLCQHLSRNQALLPLMHIQSLKSCTRTIHNHLKKRNHMSTSHRRHQSHTPTQ
ncbi:hypothetical protein RSOL_422340 [Rhizoctonia solani AG-3 Rhs1AP]|uniref:Uncharacterized protein n=1 Tax=Rhizoctonia solani AG-3 Rhs1AP TaxID=1086054 RepID=X8JGS8_9AGAM|nr:hypothetical protein RSOL_422340 [Rhizoctonia solani AG-3 Rhs1AP]